MFDILGFLFCLVAVLAPVFLAGPGNDTTPTALPQAQIDSYNPYAHYAAIAYCLDVSMNGWQCGAHCNATPGFMSLTGQYDEYMLGVYTGYDPTRNEIIMSRSGFPYQWEQVLLLDPMWVFTLWYPNATLWGPGPFGVGMWNSTIKINDLYLWNFEEWAEQDLAYIEKDLDQYPNATSIVLVGSGIGGAINVLDALFFQMHLPKKYNVTISAITFGMPRIGNQGLADYIDANLNLTHIHNKKDPISILPPQYLKVRYPSGEIHIDENGTWWSCPGQENTDPRCMNATIPDVPSGHGPDHEGPYNGINMSCEYLWFD